MSYPDIDPRDWDYIVNRRKFGKWDQNSKATVFGDWRHHHSAARKGLYTVYLYGPVLATYDPEAGGWYAPDWGAEKRLTDYSPLDGNGYPPGLCDAMVSYQQRLGAHLLPRSVDATAKSSPTYHDFLVHGVLYVSQKQLGILTKETIDD